MGRVLPDSLRERSVFPQNEPTERGRRRGIGPRFGGAVPSEVRGPLAVREFSILGAVDDKVAAPCTPEMCGRPIVEGGNVLLRLSRTRFDADEFWSHYRMQSKCLLVEIWLSIKRFLTYYHSFKSSSR